MVVIPRFERINYVIQEIYSVLHESTAFYTNLFRFAYILPRYDFLFQKTRRTVCFRPFSALVSGLRKGQYQGSPHNSVRTEPEVPSRRLSFVGVSMTDVWEAIQEEDGKKPFKKTMEKAKKSTSRY